MRKFLLLFILTSLFYTGVKSQGFNFSCNRDTAIACSLNCFTLIARIPDIHSATTNYVINPLSVVNGCYNPYVAPDSPGVATNLNIDDVYSGVVNIGFPFPFYGSTYNQLVVSTNGYVSFDLTRSGQFSHYSILNSGGALSPTSGTPQDLPSTLYDKALIMGPYHDLDIAYTTSPNRQIKYDLRGTAPHRRWVLSFNMVPLFQTPNCSTLIQNTCQIVLYEGSGIIEVFIADQQQCPSWNQGRAMVGIQDFSRTQAVMAPGRKASDPPWGTPGMHESWRFVPSDGYSLFKKVELYDLAGTLLAVGDTVGIGNGVLQTTFPNVCPATGGNTSVIVKSYYRRFDDTTQLEIGLDTINVIRNAGVITSTATGVNCATGSGTITVTTPTGANIEYSIDGGSWQSSNVFTASPGVHVVSARIIGSSCSSSMNVTISNTSTLNGSYSTIDAACAGSASGAIIVQGLLGTAPYQYSLDGGPFQVSDTFHNVSSGNHTVKIKDAGSCTFIISNVFVGVNGSLSAPATVTNASCAGAANGTITVTPVNGTGPYTYTLSTLSGTLLATNTTGIFTGLASGNYMISVTDAGGCNTSYGKTVGTDSNGFNATAVATPSGCSPSGTITVTPTPPAPGPFTYSLDGGPSQASNVFNGVSAGTHSVVVTQGGSCTYTVTNIIITSTGGLTATADSTNSECSGALTGSITVHPNGVAPYTYQIDAGPLQNGNVFSGLTSGPHTIVVNDASGCTYSFVVSVGIGSGLTATATTGNTACSGVSTGTISVFASGIPPYQYKIDAGVFQGSNIFNGLAAGTHHIIVKDTAGCIYPFDQTINSNPGVTAFADSTNTACTGVSSGTITVTANGIAPYTYSIDALPAQNSNIFSGLSAGTHTIIVRDASGCSFTFMKSVGTNPGVTAFADTTNTSCNTASTGSITVHASGVAPYTYKIDNGPLQNSNIFNGLSAGSHTITVNDAAGCIFIFQQVIAANIGVTATPTIGNAGCPGSATGNILVNPIGGLSPYKYSLNGGPLQNSNSFTNLLAGTYTMFIQDAGNCSYTFQARVNNNPLVTATVTAVQPGCFGTASGSLTLNPMFGTLPYSYSINAAPFQGNNVFNNLVAGTYNLHVRDATLCQFDTTVTLNQPALFKVTRSVNAASCSGNDGTINVTAIGGTSPFQYSVDGGATYQPNNLFIDSIGSYNIRIKDANGCTADTTASIVLNNTMFLTLSSDTTVCQGSPVAFTPSTNPQTNIFIWTPTGGAINATTGAYTVSPNDTTKYFLIAKWGVCQLRDSGTVNVLHKPIPYAGKDTIVCFNTSAFLNGTVSNISGAVKYLWSPATDLARADTSNTIAFPRTTGPHNYTLQVTDTYGCNFITTDNIVVTMNPPVPAFAGRDTIAAMNLPHQLFGSGGVSYLWAPAFPLDNPTAKNPIATLSGDQQFTLKVTDNGGCVGYDTVFVKVYVGPTYYLPNAFTPNGDGINDYFRAIPPGITKTDYFRVFNRWGQMIFETHDYLKGWDGTFIGKPQPAGAYVWIIKGVDKFGKIVEMKGTVMLIR